MTETGVPVFDFTVITTFVVQAVGSILFAIFVTKLAGNYLEKSWGRMVVEVCAFGVVGYFIWFNDASVNAIKGFVGAITGAA
jgi:hypothetical protein